MDLIGIVGRLEFLAPHSLVETISHHVVDPLLGTGSGFCDGEVVEKNCADVSMVRRVLITWAFLYVSSVILYLVAAGSDFLFWFFLMRNRVFAAERRGGGGRTTGNKEGHDAGDFDPSELKREIALSVKSMIVMTAFSTPAEVLIQLGYSKTYTNVEDYGWTYLLLSPVLFLLFSDCIIYFIHRGLHHRLLYRAFHKPHHSFIHTTPFAAFAFHPVDGYAQGIAYHLFVFLMPMHYLIHFVSLIAVSCWTINIHDRVSFNIPGVNGAKHHRIHHTTFSSNYGQYFTFWDRVCGTYKCPFDVEKHDEYDFRDHADKFERPVETKKVR